MSHTDVWSYYNSDETVRIARKMCEAQQSNKISPKTIRNPKNADRMQSSPCVGDGSTTSTLSKSPDATTSGGQLTFA